MAVAEHTALDLVARHGAGADAVVIGVSFDVGLRALRELAPVPVVGMTEAACLVACTLGGPFGIVTYGARSAGSCARSSQATAWPDGSQACMAWMRAPPTC